MPPLFSRIICETYVVGHNHYLHAPNPVNFVGSILPWLRNPTNIHDLNAVQVHARDVLGTIGQIGHVRRTVAEVIALLVDMRIPVLVVITALSPLNHALHGIYHVMLSGTYRVHLELIVDVPQYNALPVAQQQLCDQLLNHALGLLVQLTVVGGFGPLFPDVFNLAAF